MKRVAIVGILISALAGPAVAEDGARPGEARHSGRIVQVAGDGSTIVLEEIVAWTGPGTGTVTRSIAITPRTAIRLVERTGQWDDTPMPGWDARSIEARDLRQDDFVTVSTNDDRHATALALHVVRPDGR